MVMCFFGYSNSKMAGALKLDCFIITVVVVVPKQSLIRIIKNLFFFDPVQTYIINDLPPNCTDQKDQHIFPVSPRMHFTFHSFGVYRMALNKLEDIRYNNELKYTKTKIRIHYIANIERLLKSGYLLYTSLLKLRSTINHSSLTPVYQFLNLYGLQIRE